jgi:hypothetical protein
LKACRHGARSVSNAKRCGCFITPRYLHTLYLSVYSTSYLHFPVGRSCFVILHQDQSCDSSFRITHTPSSVNISRIEGHHRRRRSIILDSRGVAFWSTHVSITKMRQSIHDIPKYKAQVWKNDFPNRSTASISVCCFPGSHPIHP